MNRLSDIDALDSEASDAIDAQAASWFARNRNTAARADRKAFAAWQAEPAHARAYAEFEQLWADLAQLQQLNKPVALPTRKPSVWRPALAVAAALLCAVLTTHIGAPRELYHTQMAAHAKGMRTLDLPDGSTLFINANTRVRVDFSAHQRIVHLDKGQVYIEVAADKERPLFVQAGAASVRVVGTGFDVRRSQQQLVVSVAHGQVAFEPDAKSPRYVARRPATRQLQLCQRHLAAANPRRRRSRRLAQRALVISQPRAGQPDRRTEPVPAPGAVAGEQRRGAPEGLGQPRCQRPRCPA